jgi:nitrogen regulatory protein PII
MKKIKAYIQTFMLQQVTDELHKIHIHGMSVWEIKGFGKEKDEPVNVADSNLNTQNSKVPLRDLFIPRKYQSS